MNFYFLLILFKKVLVFWLFNFIIGFPVVYFFKEKLPKVIVGLNQFIGLCILSIILFWLNFFNLKQDILLLSIILMVCSLLISVFLILNDLKKSIGFKNIFFKIGAIIRNDFYHYLVYILFVLVLVFPQKTFPPFIPSYEVNHDPVIVLFLSKKVFGDTNIGSLNFKNELFTNSVYKNYPLGFSSLLNFFHVLFKLDYYYTAQILNILIYSVSFVFLSFFFTGRTRYKKLIIVYASVFFGLLSYFPVQYLNQSFYGSISLTPFLFASLFAVFEILKGNNTLYYLILILSTTVSLIMYSLTIFFWFIPLILILFIYLAKNHKLNLNFKKLFFSLLSFILLSLPFLVKAINLFYQQLFVNSHGTESSFFGANGNLYGFPSLLIVFSSWFSSDFRISDSVIANKYSFLFFIILIIFSIYAFWVLKKSDKKIFADDTYILFVVFLLPWVFSFFVFKSPYYFCKTLLYSSIFFMSFLYFMVFSILTNSKNIFLISFSVLILVVFLNNTLVSVNYFGKPPVDKFIKIQQLELDLKKENVNSLVAIDDEDWLKYFLYDFGSCVTYVRSYPCGLNTINENADGSITIKDNGYYLVGKKYFKKINIKKTMKIILENDYYVLLRN